MGWKGTFRSIEAAARRAERESQRQQRELEKHQKEYAKNLELEQAAHDVEDYNNHIDSLLSIHKVCSPKLDWNKINSSSPPEKPAKIETNTIRAKEKYLKYKPSLFDKILFRTELKRRTLAHEVKKAKEEDSQLYLSNIEGYKKDVARWKKLHELSSNILSGDPNSYIQAIGFLNPFRNISELGSLINFHADHRDYIETTLHVNGEDVIPEEAKTLLKTGKVSIKKIPKSKFYELYQDYVCGCVLRIAREAFSLLPIRMIVIIAETKLLNMGNGHMEEKPILSVVFPRSTIDGLDFDRLDPSDSMNNFVHKMSFTRTKGFEAVERISKQEISKLTGTTDGSF